MRNAQFIPKLTSNISRCNSKACISKIAVLALVALTGNANLILAQEKFDLDRSVQTPFISSVEFVGGIELSRPLTPGATSQSLVTRLGPTAGIGFVHDFNDRISINAKILYRSKGLKMDNSQVDESYVPPATIRVIQDVRMDYVTLVAMPRWQPIKRVPAHLAIGPYTSIIIKEKGSTLIYQNGQLIGKRGGKPLPEDFKDFDIGLSACVSYDFKVGSTVKISTQCIYNRGLQKMNGSGIADYVNNSFSLLLGITVLKQIRLNL